MKRVFEQLLKKPCIACPVTDSDRQTFSNVNHLQRYHPGLDAFPLPEGEERPFLSLEHPWSIAGWLDASGTRDPRIYKVLLRDASGNEEVGETFIKTVHLLNPIGILQDEFMVPEHPLLPQGDAAWKNTLLKLHSQSNQAYVDAIASYVVGQLRHQGLTPHGVLTYGSFTGIANSYRYCITDDFESYRKYPWFWKGLKKKHATLEVEKDRVNILEAPEYTNAVKSFFSCPIEYQGGEDEVLVDILAVENEDKASLHSFDFEDFEEGSIQEGEREESSEESSEEGSEEGSSEEGSEEEGSEEEGSDEGSEEGSDEQSDDGTTSLSSSLSTEYDINLNIKAVPVIMICQEAQEGTMDELLDAPSVAGQSRDTPQWESVWVAWLFQVVATLTFLQKHIGLTHNDLHSNNIVWRTTTDEFLYYRANDGTVWSVPTYGKIFSIIDYGRAIFKIQGHLWISDDHWPDNDAGGQYNFGPFYSIERPKVSPNPSFDLCRLAISVIASLYPERPAKKKGGVLMSQERTWKVWETVSPLYNLLWCWMLDDDGRTVFEDRHGEEKFPGFDLYVHIAQKVNDVVPKDQIRKPIFDVFRRTDMPAEAILYPIGC